MTEEQQPPPEQQTPMMVPAVFQIGVGISQDERQVILQTTILPYGQLTFALDPDVAFKVSRDLQSYAAQAKSGLRIVGRH